MLYIHDTFLLSSTMFCSFPLAAVVSDELSVSSSSSSSHGVSRTPSPPHSTTSSSYVVAGTSTLPETYSRKVFVGGLPPDIDQGTAL